jgi:hypothetical protein
MASPFWRGWLALAPARSYPDRNDRVNSDCDADHVNSVRGALIASRR